MPNEDGSLTTAERLQNHEDECVDRYRRIYQKLESLQTKVYFGFGVLVTLQVGGLIVAPIVAAYIG